MVDNPCNTFILEVFNVLRVFKEDKFLTQQDRATISIFTKAVYSWSSHRGAVETNLTRNHDVLGLIPGLAQWVKDLALP